MSLHHTSFFALATEGGAVTLDPAVAAPVDVVGALAVAVVSLATVVPAGDEALELLELELELEPPHAVAATTIVAPTAPTIHR